MPISSQQHTARNWGIVKRSTPARRAKWEPLAPIAAVAGAKVKRAQAESGLGRRVAMPHGQRAQRGLGRLVATRSDTPLLAGLVDASGRGQRLGQ